MSNEQTPKTYPTMLSQFLRDLEQVLDTHGDMPVTALGPGGEYRTARVFVEVLPYYYDGGYLLPLDDTGYHCHAWVRSRTAPGIAPLRQTTEHAQWLRIMAGQPERCCRDEDRPRDTIDGEPVPDYLYPEE